MDQEEQLIQREPRGRPHHDKQFFDIKFPFPSISFCHPAYDKLSCTLFTIPSYDSLPSGLHHESARLICSVIADNRDGWLTIERDGEKIETPEDGLLTQKRYYFRVSSDHKEKYPVVPTFSSWTFPHENLPEYWKRCIRLFDVDPSVIYTTLIDRDKTCRVSGYFEPTEQAHLIPQKEEAWFNRNSMFRYAVGQKRSDDNAIKSIDNMILLRTDIHVLFDNQKIAFIPKFWRGPNKFSIMAHVLAPGRSTQLIDDYHHVPLLHLTGIPLEYLYARFAYSVIPLLANFLRQGTPRVLAVIDENGKKVASFSSDACFRYSMANRARSESPKKRKQETSREQDMLEEDLSEVEDDLERGRKRKRSTSFSWQHSSDSGIHLDDFQLPVREGERLAV